MTALIFWYWWVLAIIFLVIEMLVSGFFFLWLAAAAGLTGLLLWLIPSLSTDSQLFIFAISAVLAIVLWRFYGKTGATITDHPLLNKRGQQYVGRIFNLYAPIINGQGRIKVDDTLWTVHGEDCPINSRVKITAVHGTTFSVEKVIAD